jgi:hypothetical protein
VPVGKQENEESLTNFPGVRCCAIWLSTGNTQKSVFKMGQNCPYVTQWPTSIQECTENVTHRPPLEKSYAWSTSLEEKGKRILCYSIFSECFTVSRDRRESASGSAIIIILWALNN